MSPDAFAAASFFDAVALGRPIPTGRGAAATPEGAAKAAADFEAFLLSDVIEALHVGLDESGPMGAGQGGLAFRSFLNEEYAKAIARAGGIGLADRLKSEILSLQARETS